MCERDAFSMLMTTPGDDCTTFFVVDSRLSIGVLSPCPFSFISSPFPIIAFQTYFSSALKSSYESEEALCSTAVLTTALNQMISSTL